MFLCGNARSQDSLSKRWSLSGFPVAYYSPESSLGIGLFGLYNFNWKNDSIGARKSSMTLGTAYTLNRQILFYLPYNLFLKNDTYRLNGEIGFYDYVYFFFGRGNVPGSYDEKKEAFSLKFPRLRTTFMRKIADNMFLGGRLATDYYYDLVLAEQSVIRDENLLGQDVGLNFGIGPAFLYDTRSSIFYPRSGYYLDVNSTVELGEIVSDYQFSRLIVDASAFRSLSKKTVLGVNLYYQQAQGEVPFYQLSMMGGGRKLRGQFEGEFRDNIAWQGQLELRQEFFKNFGAVAFVGMGVVAKTWKGFDLKNQHNGVGVGLRYKLNKKDHVNIRVDVGYGDGQWWPYFTLGEAF